MSTDPQNDSDAVPLGMLRRYLVSNHWRRLTESGRPTELNEQPKLTLMTGRTGGRRSFEIYVLSEENSEDVEIILPKEKTSPDYLKRIDGVVRTLSELEGRDPGQIISDIRSVGFDVVRSRIPDEMVHDDAVHLSIAASYTDGIKQLLTATATTELQPGPYFLRVKKEAVDYADHCRFGHTFRGSFGFTIESPISPNIEPDFLGVERTPPFERRVVQRLALGLRTICDAVDFNDTKQVTENVALGFGANAFEQLANLVERTSYNGLVFEFSFSPEWNSHSELKKRRQFKIGPQHVEVSRAAAINLRRREFKRDETIVGRVVRLQSEADPSDLLNPLGEREVVIQWSSEDLGDIHVRVSLPAAEYLVAIEAHRGGRPVKVAGTLERRGRPWILVAPTDFAVI